MSSMSLSNNQKNELLFVGFNQDYGESKYESWASLGEKSRDVKLDSSFSIFGEQNVSSVLALRARQRECT